MFPYDIWYVIMIYDKCYDMLWYRCIPTVQLVAQTGEAKVIAPNKQNWKDDENIRNWPIANINTYFAILALRVAVPKG